MIPDLTSFQFNLARSVTLQDSSESSIFSLDTQDVYFAPQKNEIYGGIFLYSFALSLRISWDGCEGGCQNVINDANTNSLGHLSEWVFAGAWHDSPRCALFSSVNFLYTHKMEIYADRFDPLHTYPFVCSFEDHQRVNFPFPFKNKNAR